MVRLKDMSTIFLDALVFAYSAVIGYILGSFNGAQILHHLPGGKYRKFHPERMGTKNSGMQNVWMTIGKVPALAVLAIDFPKGFLALYFSGHVLGLEGPLLFIPGTFAIMGHNWPFLFHFQGGRGFATLLGISFAYNAPMAIVAGLIALPFAILRFSGATPFIILSVIGVLEFPTYGFQVAIIMLGTAMILFLRRVHAEWRELKKTKRKLWMIKNILLYDRSGANPPALKEIFH